MCVQCLLRAEESTGSPGTKVTDSIIMLEAEPVPSVTAASDYNY